MRLMKNSILLFIAAFFLVSLSSNAEDKKGIVTHADGTVKRQPIETEDWMDAPVNTDVISGDKVRTYRQSRAEVNLAELDIIRLAPRTIVDFTKLYRETKEQKVETEINLKEGEIWASVHEVEMETEFDISAPVAAAAITGTVLRMNVGQDSTTQLKVYTGEVKITNAPQRTDLQIKQVGAPREVKGPVQVQGPREVSKEEWLYLVKSMQQLTFNKNGKVISQGSFSENDKDEKDDPWVKWNKERDAIRKKRIKDMMKNN